MLLPIERVPLGALRCGSGLLLSNCRRARARSAGVLDGTHAVEHARAADPADGPPSCAPRRYPRRVPRASTSVSDDTDGVPPHHALMGQWHGCLPLKEETRVRPSLRARRSVRRHRATVSLPQVGGERTAPFAQRRRLHRGSSEVRAAGSFPDARRFDSYPRHHAKRHPGPTTGRLPLRREDPRRVPLRQARWQGHPPGRRRLPRTPTSPAIACKYPLPWLRH